MKYIEVSTQAEFDAEVKLGNGVIVRAGFYIARESSHVEARESSHVEARGRSHVVARGRSHVVAWESSHVEAWESSHVEARGRSHVVAWESSHVEAWESSHVVARGRSHVVAWGAVLIRLFSALKIKASASVIINASAQYKCKNIKGGILIKQKPILTLEDWADFYGADIKKGFITLFKAVDSNYMSHRGACYKPKTKPVALDWDGGKIECGAGLHFSASPREAKRFFEEATKFLACVIKAEDVAIHPDGNYPQKVKARAVHRIYEVNIDGEKI